jgi:hypothetical protein
MKYMKTNHFLRLGITIFLFGLLAACDKNNDGDTNPATAKLQISLTDAPTVDVREVWVDIKDIQINTSDTGSWTSLSNVHTRVYNLMDLTNGRDTILADADIPAGRINQLRLLLGDNNYIITGEGQKQMLATPSAEESGLKLQVKADISGGMVYHMVLDFDAAKSIVKAGNSGNYLLKPVIRVLSFDPTGGIVMGVVVPDSVLTFVYAIMGADTISSSSTFGGKYTFRDIKAGSYKLEFLPVSDSFNIASQNIEVAAGQTIVADTVHLEHK